MGVKVVLLYIIQPEYIITVVKLTEGSFDAYNITSMLIILMLLTTAIGR